MVRRRARVAVLGMVVLVGAVAVVVPGPSASAGSPPTSPAGCAVSAEATTAAVGLPVAIPDGDANGVEVPIEVATSGLVWDVDVTVDVLHQRPRDLLLVLEPPSGREVVLSAYNGATVDEAFAGTRFDDQADPGNPVPYGAGNPASALVGDTQYVAGVTETTLAPESPLGELRGQGAAGTWRLRVVDPTAVNTGSVRGVQLHLRTTPRRIDLYERRFVQTGAVTFGPGVSTASMTVDVPPMPGTVTDVDVLVEATHGTNHAIDLSVTNGVGRSVTLSTDNGGAGTDGFHRALFDDQGYHAVTTDAFPTSGQPWAAEVRPEEALASLNGVQAAGTWTLTLSQDTATVAGELQRFEVVVRTGSCPPFGVAPPVPPLCGTVQGAVYPGPGTWLNQGAVGETTITVPPTARRVHDVDVTLQLDLSGFRQDPFEAWLESPDGSITRLVVASDGFLELTTRFDDDADPDGIAGFDRQDGVPAERIDRPWGQYDAMVPHDALGRLRGSDPSGTWTLHVRNNDVDERLQVVSWGIVLRTVPSSLVTVPTPARSGTAEVALADVGTTTSEAEVPASSWPVGSVVVFLSLEHPEPADLDLVLRSPAGTAVTLAADDLGGVPNAYLGDGGVAFGDGRGMSVQDVLGQVDDLAPEEPLAALVGEQPGGTWTLEVHDDEAGSLGVLHWWSLAVDVERCDVPPVGQADAYTVAETTALNVPAPGVLGNDTDADGDPLTATVETWPAHASSFGFSSPGGFNYAPEPRFRGQDSFQYRPVGVGSGELVTVTVTVGRPVCSPPGPFTDVVAGHPFCSEILWMANDGITEGYADGTFKPSSVVTRQAMSAFLYRTKYPAHSPAPELAPCSSPPFSDVPADSPFCPYIQWMKVSGVGGGYPDGTFRPTATITRQAMASFLFKLEHGGGAAVACTEAPFSDVPAGSPFCPQITWMADEGIAGGYADGTFKPGAAVSRQAMAAFLERFVHRPA